MGENAIKGVSPNVIYCFSTFTSKDPELSDSVNWAVDSVQERT